MAKRLDPRSAVRPGEIRVGRTKSVDPLSGVRPGEFRTKSTWSADPVSVVRPGEFKKPKAAPKMPSAKVGNYRAPVDTVGMDAEMKRTMGFGRGSSPGGRKKSKGK